MSIRQRWSTRTPGTGRLIALLCVFVPLSLLLVWAACFGGADQGEEPTSVAAEFRMVSIRGKPLSPIGCRGHRTGGRILLGTDGRWWKREMDCRTMRSPGVQTGTYRWSGDSLIVRHPAGRAGEFLSTIYVLRGDTIDIPRRHRRTRYFVRYVRVRTPPP
ncbi:MAG TPA: hypothetical protein VFY65_10715 [Longimicrobium sp.]|nr:hypothetical protein [Longimicrobium sp.]